MKTDVKEKYKEMSREELLQYILYCEEFLDDNLVEDGRHSERLSVYGRLSEYAYQKNNELATLRAERDNLAAANAELTRALRLGVYLLTIPAIQDVMKSQLENDELSPIADFENSARAVLAKGAK